MIRDALPFSDQATEEPPEGIQFSLFCLFENSHWTQNYVAGIRMMVHCHDNYSLFRCFPHIPGTKYSEEFRDEGATQSSLGHGTFKWLVCIQMSHLLWGCVFFGALHA